MNLTVWASLKVFIAFFPLAVLSFLHTASFGGIEHGTRGSGNTLGVSYRTLDTRLHVARTYKHPLLRQYLGMENERRERALDKLEQLMKHINKRRRHMWREPKPFWYRYAFYKAEPSATSRVLQRKLLNLLNSIPPKSPIEGKALDWVEPPPRWPNSYLAYSRQNPEALKIRDKMLMYHFQWHRRHILDPASQAGASWEIRLQGFDSFKPEALFTGFNGFTFADVKRAYANEPLIREGVVTQAEFYKIEKEPDPHGELYVEPLIQVVFFALFNDTSAAESLQKAHLKYHRKNRSLVEYHHVFEVPSLEYEELLLANSSTHPPINYTIPHERDMEDALIYKYWAVESFEEFVAMRTRGPEVVVDNATDPSLLTPPKRVGVLIVFNGETHVKAREYMAKDPFMLQGVYRNDSIHMGECAQYDVDGFHMYEPPSYEPGPPKNPAPKPHEVLLHEMPPLDNMPDHHDLNLKAAETYTAFIERGSMVREELRSAWLIKEHYDRMYPRGPPKPTPVGPDTGLISAGYDDLETIKKRRALPNVR